MMSLDDLLDLGDDGPERRRRDAEELEQPLDDELDRIVEEAADGGDDPPDETARLLAQLGDLGPHLVDRLARALDEILVEVVARRDHLVVEVVELAVELLLFLGRPALQRGRQLSEDLGDALARARDDEVAGGDDRVDLGRDRRQLVDHPVGEVLLGPVIRRRSPSRADP